MGIAKCSLQNDHRPTSRARGRGPFRPFVLNLVRDDIDLAEDVFTFELAAASGHKTFLVERRGDLLVHLAGSIELRTLPQPTEIDLVSICVNPSLQAMLADGAGLSRDLEPYLTPRSRF